MNSLMLTRGRRAAAAADNEMTKSRRRLQAVGAQVYSFAD